jgi:beta-barrel assembly-enhancing protease
MNTLKRILGILLAVLIPLQMAQPRPAFGITIQEEEELSKEFMKMVTKRFRFIRDPLLVDYVNDIGQKILSEMQPQPFAYRFYIIDQEIYNAFAGPGGNIFINSGLIEAMDSEDELAGILAHEITHVAARHISQKIDRSSKIGLATLAGIVAGILLGVAGAGAAANAVSVGSMAAGQSAALSYSRQDEMQADELGIRYLTDAGYSGAGLLTVLKKIRDKQWFGSEEIPTYLMTHPAVEERIAYLDTWIESNPDALPAPGTDQTEFERMRTRLVAGYGDKDRALREMTAAAKDHPDDPVYQHGYGITLARNDRHEEALDQVRKALKSRPLDPVMLKDLGEIYFIDGQYDQAVSALEGSVGLDPGDPEALYLLGRSRIELKHFSDAAEVLERLLEKRPNFPGALFHLGEAYGKQGDLARAHFYLGKHYAYKKEVRNAVFHLRQVLKRSDDPIRKAEAEEMLKAVREEGPKEEAPEPVQRPRPTRNPRPPAFFSFDRSGKTAW